MTDAGRRLLAHRRPGPPGRGHRRHHPLLPARGPAAAGGAGGAHQALRPRHLARLERIRELQGRRFSLAAIRALLDAERPGLVEGIFGGERASYTFDELVEQTGHRPQLSPGASATPAAPRPGRVRPRRLRRRRPRRARRGGRAAGVGIPTTCSSRSPRSTREGVEAMERQVVEVFGGERGRRGSPASSRRSRPTRRRARRQPAPAREPPRRLRPPPHAAAPHARRDRDGDVRTRASAHRRLTLEASRCQMRAPRSPPRSCGARRRGCCPSCPR